MSYWRQRLWNQNHMFWDILQCVQAVGWCVWHRNEQTALCVCFLLEGLKHLHWIKSELKQQNNTFLITRRGQATVEYSNMVQLCVCVCVCESYNMRLACSGSRQVLIAFGCGWNEPNGSLIKTGGGDPLQEQREENTAVACTFFHSRSHMLHPHLEALNRTCNSLIFMSMPRYENLLRVQEP